MAAFWVARARAGVGACGGRRRSKRRSFAPANPIAHRRDLVQNGPPEAADDVHVARPENQMETREIAFTAKVLVTRIQPWDVVPEGQRGCEYAQPARVFADPVDALQRHANDLGSSSVRAEAEQF